MNPGYDIVTSMMGKGGFGVRSLTDIVARQIVILLSIILKAPQKLDLMTICSADDCLLNING